MPKTNMFGWEFPAEEQDNWFAIHERLFQDMDAEAYANFESQLYVTLGAESAQWNPTTGQLAIPNGLQLLNTVQGRAVTVAPATVSVPDGAVVFVSVPRPLGANANGTLEVATSMSGDRSRQLVAIRKGAALIFFGNALEATLRNVDIDIVTGYQGTSDAIATRKGGRKIDLARFPAALGLLTRQVKLLATLDSSASGVNSQVDLYDATNGVIVSGSQIDNSAAPNKTIPTEVSSPTLTVGAAAGNLRSDAAAMYLLRLTRVGGGSSDIASVTNARLEVRYV